VSTDKIKQSAARMRQRMRVTLLLNWEAKQKCSEDMLSMGRYPNKCWRVGHKLNADHRFTLCNVRLAPSDNRSGTRKQ
jgi:hypothetical protein